MFFDQIFKEGWLFTVLIYAIVYFLAEYATYTIVFRNLMGTPKSYSLDDIRHWRSKASFWSAVIFAPFYEEVMFTWLAYTNFLSFAKEGQYGLVLILVACFFSILHLPGDVRSQLNSFGALHFGRLLRFQFNRIFYSLTAFFIFSSLLPSYGLVFALGATITLHYFYNALVTFFNYDLQDRTLPNNNFILSILISLNIGFGFFATYHFYPYSPNLSIILIIGIIILFVNYFR